MVFPVNQKKQPLLGKKNKLEIFFCMYTKDWIQFAISISSFKFSWKHEKVFTLNGVGLSLHPKIGSILIKFRCLLRPI